MNFVLLNNNASSLCTNYQIKKKMLKITNNVSYNFTQQSAIFYHYGT